VATVWLGVGWRAGTVLKDDGSGAVSVGIGDGMAATQPAADLIHDLVPGHVGQVGHQRLGALEVSDGWSVKNEAQTAWTKSSESY